VKYFLFGLALLLLMNPVAFAAENDATDKATNNPLLDVLLETAGGTVGAILGGYPIFLTLTQYDGSAPIGFPGPKGPRALWQTGLGILIGNAGGVLLTSHLIAPGGNYVAGGIGSLLGLAIAPPIAGVVAVLWQSSDEPPPNTLSRRITSSVQTIVVAVPIVASFIGALAYTYL